MESGRMGRAGGLRDQDALDEQDETGQDHHRRADPGPALEAATRAIGCAAVGVAAGRRVVDSAAAAWVNACPSSDADGKREDGSRCTQRSTIASRAAGISGMNWLGGGQRSLRLAQGQGERGLVSGRSPPGEHLVEDHA